jgi:hypothetical protein
MNIRSVASELFQMGGPTDTTQLMAVLCSLFFNKPKDYAFCMFVDYGV